MVMKAAAPACPCGRSDGWVHQWVLIEIALREQQYSMGDRIRHLIEPGVTVVRERVTCQVVARIVLFVAWHYHHKYR